MIGWELIFSMDRMILFRWPRAARRKRNQPNKIMSDLTITRGHYPQTRSWVILNILNYKGFDRCSCMAIPWSSEVQIIFFFDNISGQNDNAYNAFLFNTFTFDYIFNYYFSISLQFWIINFAFKQHSLCSLWSLTYYSKLLVFITSRWCHSLAYDLS